ncbi:hypothetical protein QP880_06345 [Dermabacter hominis]|nr:hypothetical protein [Dermabacter hominis]
MHLDIAQSVRTRGWTTALVSGHALAVDLGMSRACVSRALTVSESWGWLRLLPATASRYGPQMRSRRRCSRASAMICTICSRACVSRCGATRPRAGHAAYLVAVADAAEAAPKPMGVTRQTAREVRALLDSIGDPTDAEARADAVALMGATDAAVAAAERAGWIETTTETTAA